MKKKSLTIIIRDKLKETFDWYVSPDDNMPTDKQLYYEALRIEKAIKKEIKTGFLTWKGVAK